MFDWLIGMQRKIGVTTLNPDSPDFNGNLWRIKVVRKNYLDKESGLSLLENISKIVNVEQE